ncbi:hypothetical protein ACW9I8_30265 [Pseudomonas reactans]
MEILPEELPNGTYNGRIYDNQLGSIIILYIYWTHPETGVIQHARMTGYGLNFIVTGGVIYSGSTNKSPAYLSLRAEADQDPLNTVFVFNLESPDRNFNTLQGKVKVERGGNAGNTYDAAFAPFSP